MYIFSLQFLSGNNNEHTQEEEEKEKKKKEAEEEKENKEKEKKNCYWHYIKFYTSNIAFFQNIFHLYLLWTEIKTKAYQIKQTQLLTYNVTFAKCKYL
jgi:heme/copper-type cytochrome/quinol oxidase subunit 3